MMLRCSSLKLLKALLGATTRTHEEPKPRLWLRYHVPILFSSNELGTKLARVERGARLL